ncbi:TasA family protein [Tenuibacillus multivorans]|uniref:Spore coat-associated protein N n=1 Tax=Tenuibacillus multivorans TaxID=237069 RepID=A0A1G9WVY3_9BACI|nr:TasA family protein [Tenuibacillus multivorans]GEL78411.1 spore coat-associated protein N [Tenuibacillus multivorans]SDM88411.1 spore coat-associated protein N [Tenuibacillus multivorans]
MDIKKKLGIGVLTGALGISLIGGGTWAAFNDVEETQNTFAAGTLDLVIGEESTIDFELENLKPGDHWTETLVLENNGSLDINQILTDIEVSGWDDEDALNLNEKLYDGAGNNSDSDFFSQFNVEVKDAEGNSVYNDTLDNFQGFSGDITGTGDDEAALNPEEALMYEITFTFEDDDTRFDGSRYFIQNKYQNERADIGLTFEATQMPGEDRSDG